MLAVGEWHFELATHNITPPDHLVDVMAPPPHPAERGERPSEIPHLPPFSVLHGLLPPYNLLLGEEVGVLEAALSTTHSTQYRLHGEVCEFACL